MINKMDKMRRTQRKAREYLLKNLDFEFVWFIHHTRYSKDIAIPTPEGNACFDGMGIKKKKTYYIQVKSNKKPNTRPYHSFFMRYGIPYLMLVWYDYHGFKIFSSIEIEA